VTISAEGVAGAGYYTGGGSSSSGTNYYTGAVGAVEPPGQWGGKFAAALGLTGEVRPSDFEALIDRFTAPDGTRLGNADRDYKSLDDRVAERLAGIVDPLPEDVARIRSEVERETRSTQHGVDLTYSPQKSVTVAHAAGWRGAIEATRSGFHDRAIEYESIRSGIEEDVIVSNEALMSYLESITTTRQGAGYGHAVVWVPVDGVARASFLQHTSRANDPQVHIHNTIVNRAIRSTDGAVRTLAVQDLIGHKMLASAIADRVLAERLADRGIATAMRQDGIAREILGIGKDALDTFSQRSQAIRPVAAAAIAREEERRGRELTTLERGRINEWATLATRNGKTADLDVDTLLDGWQDRLTAELGMGLVPIADRLLLAMEDGPLIRDGGFSPDAVAAEAVHRVSQSKASFTYGDLAVEVEHCAPLVGLPADQVLPWLTALTDHALASTGCTQVAGNPGLIPPADLVAGSYVPKSAARYAAPETLAAERAIRESAVRHQGHAVNGAAVDAWLTDSAYRDIGPDQRAAVVGLASRNAALAQLVGPAGTGKSFAGGALAGAWEELSGGGRVVGLAVSQTAADVLRDDGVTVTANLAAWKASQARLESGNPLPGDLPLAIGPRDLVLLDESSMLDRAHVTAVQDVTDSIGARVILAGDPRQLGSIGAGGAMGLVADRGDTYTLTDVRRFAEEWERTASLGLRDGSLDALREYDIHGRLVAVDTPQDAIASAARAAAADILAGRSVAVMAPTNAEAAQVANAVREHLTAAGVVEEDGVQLQRTGGIAGIGDQVMTRQIDRSLGVLNGSTFTVVGTGDDGSLSVVDDAGKVVELPAAYVDEHVQHAYASTVHCAQGKTVDRGYTVGFGYVEMTRGRERNTAFVPVGPSPDDDARLVAATEHGGELQVKAPDARPSAFAVLADELQRDNEQRAALVEQEIDTEHLASMSTIVERLEHGTDAACRSRLDDHLDRLVEDGVLSEDTRANLAADGSTAHLSRVCRAAEQSGHDPASVLRAAVEGRALTGSRSEAKVIAGRIASAVDVSAASAASSVIPSGLSPEWSTYLGQLHEQAEERTAELGARAVEDVPAWAVRALGPVPDDAAQLLEWQERAGVIAGYREASGHEAEERAIPSAPGITQTEARAAWWGAWEALGRPQETRPEAALSDGALQARVTAWEREQAWAPPHANASLKAAELDADEARREAVLSRFAGDDDAAGEWEAEAEQRAAVARVMGRTAEARGLWAANTSMTRDLAERAAEELEARGLTRGEESDRVTAEEWLEHQREADARDEAVRDVTELDVPASEATDDAEPSATLRESQDVDALDTGDADTQDGGADISGENPGLHENPRESVHAEQASAPETREDADTASPVAGDDVPESSTRDTDDASQVRAVSVESVGSAEPEGASSPDDSADDTPEPTDSVEDRSIPPARAEAPMEPSDVELDALVHASRQAEERVADRASEEAAHEAWEAEQSAVVADDSADVAEYA
jgi:conjugative relaxase-like TrwC/TraI family protein